MSAEVHCQRLSRQTTSLDESQHHPRVNRGNDVVNNRTRYELHSGFFISEMRLVMILSQVWHDGTLDKTMAAVGALARTDWRERTAPGSGILGTFAQRTRSRLILLACSDAAVHQIPSCRNRGSYLGRAILDQPGHLDAKLAHSRPPFPKSSKCPPL